MDIALDYDETITRDPAFWGSFVKLVRAHGHKVSIVTMRYAHEPVDHHFDCPVFYTNRELKRPFMYREHQKHFHVWIDDNPDAVNGGGSILHWYDLGTKSDPIQPCVSGVTSRRLDVNPNGDLKVIFDTKPSEDA